MRAGGASRFALLALASAAFACLSFFGLLALWGLVAAPFARLRSASFVVAVALALSVALTVAASVFASRRFSERRAGEPRT